MNTSTFLSLLLCCGASSALAEGESLATSQHQMLNNAERAAKRSVAYQWLDIMQEAAAQDVDRYGPRPTVLSRSMAIWATAVYDAWAAYDDHAVGTRLGSKARQPKAERTRANQEVAIHYASYHALSFVFPESRAWLEERLRSFGLNPSTNHRDTRSPQRVAKNVVDALIEYRQRDGANQLGDEAGGGGLPYDDYTYYRPVNRPDQVLNPDRWQPITFTMSDGTKVTPGFLTPHWYRVKPFALERPDQFRPPPPPQFSIDPAPLRQQVEEVLHLNGHLTNQEKAIVEFMRDGPRSTGQSGHWLRFAQDVSHRDGHNLERDVKLFFVVANVAFDAFISCWDAKRFYDTARPWTLVHYLYRGIKVRAWAGPAGGTHEVAGENWHPYSPASFVTPPFPGYTSGHATVSGAASKILELFTATDHYGFFEKRKHCELTEEDAGTMVTLDLPTWSAVAEMAAHSRALGGYHIPIDNEVGLALGREIALWSWPKYQEYFSGTAQVRP